MLTLFYQFSNSASSFVILIIVFTCLEVCVGSHRDSNDVDTKIIKIPLKRSKSGFVYNNYNLFSNLPQLESVQADKILRGKRSYTSNIHGVVVNDLIDFRLKGALNQGYYIEILIGTPTQALNVLIDTGSSNFAVAATPHPLIDKFFDPTRSTSLLANDKELFTVPYIQGEWVGYSGRDVVRIPPFVDVPIETGIDFITQSSNFFIVGTDWQGILGLAYPQLSIHSSQHHKSTIWDDVLKALNVTDTFSLSLCKSHGSMVLGGADQEKYIGEIYYTPINKEWYYDVLVMDILIGGATIGLDCKEYNFDKVIVDSGTTLLYFPPTVYNQLVKFFIKNVQTEFPETFWQDMEAVCYNYNMFPWEDLPNLTISFFSTSLSTSSYNAINLVISPKLYIREVYTSSDGWFPDRSCYKFSIIKSHGGTIIGAVIMEGFYTVFDKLNKRIGFAVSSCIPPGWSSIQTSIEIGDFNKCAYKALNIDKNFITIFIAICVLICSILFLFFFYCIIKVEFFHDNDAPQVTKLNNEIPVLKQ